MVKSVLSFVTGNVDLVDCVATLIFYTLNI